MPRTVALLTASASTLASAMTDKDTGGGSSGMAVAAAVAAVAVVVAIALWLLFRRGSIADRARTDVPDLDDSTPQDPPPPFRG